MSALVSTVDLDSLLESIPDLTVREFFNSDEMHWRLIFMDVVRLEYTGPDGQPYTISMVRTNKANEHATPEVIQ